MPNPNLTDLTDEDLFRRLLAAENYVLNADMLPLGMSQAQHFPALRERRDELYRLRIERERRAGLRAA